MKRYILHIVKWYPNAIDDLEGVFIKRHIECVKKYFPAIVIFARVSNRHNSVLQFETTETPNYCTYIAYYRQNISGIKPIDKLLKLCLYYIAMVRMIHRAIKRYGMPVLIHAHVMLRTGILAYLYGKKFKIPYLITEHATLYGSETYQTNLNIKHQLRKFIINKAIAVIAVSLDLEKKMKRLGFNKASYYRVYNSVDTNIFHYKSKSSYQTTRLLHVSEFKNEHKNILGLLEVIKTLHQEGFVFELKLVGYGQDLNVIKDYIDSANLNPVVHYLGKLRDVQLHEQYTQADALVLFSNKENMPCVIAESLCSGTPVVSTHVGGIGEIINPENGILIEKANQIQLREALIQIIRRNQAFDHALIAKEAFKQFSEEAIGNKLAGIYTALLTNS